MDRKRTQPEHILHDFFSIFILSHYGIKFSSITDEETAQIRDENSRKFIILIVFECWLTRVYVNGEKRKDSSSEIINFHFAR